MLPLGTNGGLIVLLPLVKMHAARRPTWVGKKLPCCGWMWSG